LCEAILVSFFTSTNWLRFGAQRRKAPSLPVRWGRLWLSRNIQDGDTEVVVVVVVVVVEVVAAPPASPVVAAAVAGAASEEGR
jgi:hypothetical protein